MMNPFLQKDQMDSPNNIFVQNFVRNFDNESNFTRSLSNEPNFHKSLNNDRNSSNEPILNRNANEPNFSRNSQNDERYFNRNITTSNEVILGLNINNEPIYHRALSNDLNGFPNFKEEKDFSKSFNNDGETIFPKVKIFQNKLNNESNEICPSLFHRSSKDDSNKNSNNETNEVSHPFFQRNSNNESSNCGKEKKSNSLFKASISDLEFGNEFFQNSLPKESKNMLQCNR